MINEALDFVFDQMPKFNKIMAEGLAYHQMRTTPAVIDNIMKTALRSSTEPRLPKDFNYQTYRVLDPFEEYIRCADKLVKTKNTKVKKAKGYDLTLNDTYMVEYIFDVAGKEYVRPISIPFVRRGGITHIKGVKYGISPVLKTRGVSPTDKGFFIEFQSSKVQFESINHSFDINGNVQHVYMPLSTTLHHSKSSKRFVPPVAAWLFAKHGTREVFRKYLDMDISFYDINDPALADIDTDIYAVCTGGIAVKKNRANFAVVVDKEKLTPTAKIIIGTLFYVGRIQHSRLNASNIESDITWSLLLGIAIRGDKGSPNQTLISDIKRHFNNIENMLDSQFQSELVAEGIIVEDIYELLFYIIQAFTNRDTHNTSKLANLWGRYYTCSEYVTSDIRCGIYNAHWDLINQATNQTAKTTGNVVKYVQIQWALNCWINTSAIQSINNKHGEVNAFMSTTDNMIIALTSHCIDQTDANKTGSKKSIDLHSPSNHMHTSFCEVGSVCNLPKSVPIGPYRINMCVKTDVRGRTIESDKYREIKDELTADIQQKGYDLL